MEEQVIFQEKCLYFVFSNLTSSGVGKSATIHTVAMHAERILRKEGDHPHHPRVLICAPTGKAASLVSKYTSNFL